MVEWWHGQVSVVGRIHYFHFLRAKALAGQGHLGKCEIWPGGGKRRTTALTGVLQERQGRVE